MAIPAFTAAEAINRETFLALMWSFSYPGRVHALPQERNPFHLVADALLDLETTFYTNDTTLARQISRTSARFMTLETAEYALFPRLTEADLEGLAQLSVGSMHRPDEAATLVVGCTLDTGKTFRVTGPGVKDSMSIQVGGLPPVFWTLRQRSRRFPLGWDIFLIDAAEPACVLGLPRSVTLTEL